MNVSQSLLDSSFLQILLSLLSSGIERGSEFRVKLLRIDFELPPSHTSKRHRIDPSNLTVNDNIPLGKRGMGGRQRCRLKWVFLYPVAWEIRKGLEQLRAKPVGLRLRLHQSLLERVHGISGGVSAPTRPDIIAQHSHKGLGNLFL